MTAKVASNLPSYEIVCSSDKCIEFNIVPFEAAETPKFRFNIPNVKKENYTSTEQVIN